jgi:hypothetical protein
VRKGLPRDKPSDTPVTLVATPYSGSSFIGWRGGGCSGTDSCTVTLTSSTTVLGVFAKGVVDEDDTAETVNRVSGSE